MNASETPSSPPASPTVPPVISPPPRRRRPLLAFWLSTAAAVGLLAVGFQVASESSPTGLTGTADLHLFSDSGATVGFSPTDNLTLLGTYARPEMSSTATYQIDIAPRGSSSGSPAAMPVSLSAASPLFPSPLIASNAWTATFQDATSTWQDRQPLAGDQIRTLRYTYKPSVPPPFFQAADFSGTGDGYHPMSYITNVRGKAEAMVLVINHHTNNQPIQCRMRSDVTKACPGFPQTAGGSPTGGLNPSTVKGTSLIDIYAPYHGDLGTPSSMLFSRIDAATGRLYFPAMAFRNVPASGVKVYDLGVACVDFSRLPYTSCGFKVLANTFRSSFGDFIYYSQMGVGVVGTKIFMSEPTGRLLCYDSSNDSDCSFDSSGQPLKVPLDETKRRASDGAIWDYAATSTASDTGRIFLSGKYIGDGSFFLTCFDTRSNSVCSGSWPKALSGGPQGTVMFSPTNLLPIPTATGELAGICARGRSGQAGVDAPGNRAIIDPASPDGRANSPFLACYTPDGRDLQVPRAFYALAVERGTTPTTELTTSGTKPRWFWTGLVNPWGGIFSSARYGSKVLGVTQAWDRNVVDKEPTAAEVDSYMGPAIKDAIWCVDIATGATCNELGNLYPVFLPEGHPYVIREDNTRTGCFWLLGDLAKGYPFEADTGVLCGDKTVEFRVNTKPLDYYGYDPTLEQPIVYSKIVLGNMVWGKDISDTDDGIKVTFTDKATGNVVKTVYFPRGALTMDVPADITFAKYPDLLTSVIVSRPRPNPPLFNENAQADLSWSGPPVQLGLRAALNNSSMCLLDGTIQPTVTAPDGSSQAGSVALGNALVRGVPGSNDALQPIITNRFALKASYGTGATAVDLPMSLLLRPRYDQTTYTGDLLLRGLIAYNAAYPDSANERSVGAGGLTAASTPTATARNVQTLNAAGQTVAFTRATLDAPAVDALNRNRSGLVDNRADQRIDYLRGKRSDEVGYVSAGGVKGTLFRRRVNVDATAASTDLPPKIGPVINGGVGLLDPKANSFYSGAVKGYADYIKATGRTQPVALVASNDGMVHGYRINGDLGNAGSVNLKETFAYLPRGLTPRLAGLTERSAAQLYINSYYLDSTPTVGDVDLSNGAGTGWRSVAVLPYGRSVKGVMALDVTRADQDAAKTGLWEFTDQTPVQSGQPDPAASMGYITAQAGASPSNPSVSSQIARVDVGGTVRSAYVFGNGYGSTSGNATLFVAYMDGAVNGQPQYAGVTVPDAGSNGLSTPLLVSNSAGVLQYALAGDLKGNLWRFDFTTGTIKADLIFKAAQPIVAAPALVNTTAGPVLVLGTGKPQPSQLRIETTSGTGTYALYGLRLGALLSSPGNSGGVGDVLSSILGGKVSSTTPSLTLGSVGTGTVDGRTSRTVSFSGTIGANGWMLNLPQGEMVLGNIFAHPTNNQIIATALTSASAGAICSAGESVQYVLNPMAGTGRGLSNNPTPGNNTQRIARAAPPNAQGQMAVGGVSGSKDPNTGKANPTQTLDKAYYSGRLSWRELSN